MQNDKKTIKEEKESDMDEIQTILPEDIESYMNQLELRGDVLKRILEINKKPTDFNRKKK
jgi:stage III sporulation protein SpoIIIAA